VIIDINQLCLQGYYTLVGNQPGLAIPRMADVG